MNPKKVMRKCFTLEEVKAVIDFIILNLDPGQQIHSDLLSSEEVFLSLEKDLDRLRKNIYRHWWGTLYPIIHSHELGCLHKDITADFLQTLIDDRVKSVADINWEKVLAMFPGQTRVSLGGIYNRVLQNAVRDHGCPKDAPA